MNYDRSLIALIIGVISILYIFTINSFTQSPIVKYKYVENTNDIIDNYYKARRYRELDNHHLSVMYSKQVLNFNIEYIDN